MSRYALLIEAADSSIPGAKADVLNFEKWLRSSAGGAWNHAEIDILSNPSSDSVRQAIDKSQSVDYFFAAFSGHGKEEKGSLRTEPLIMINPREYFYARQLTMKCKRATAVIDSCRYLPIQLSLNESIKYARAKSYSEDSRRQRHRDLFDNLVKDAEEGAVFLFGCSPDQGANDYPNGGAFTFSLIDEGTKWYEPASGTSVLRMNDAFALAKKAVEAIVTGQTPMMDGSMRRQKHFPFSVYVA